MRRRLVCAAWCALALLMGVPAYGSRQVPDGSAELRLEIVNEAGKGVAQVGVFLASVDSAETKLAQGATGAGGLLTLRLPAGIPCLIGVRPLWRGSPENVELTPLASGEVRTERIAIRTQPDLRLRRQVVWAESSEPVPQAGLAVVNEWRDFHPGQPADVEAGKDGYLTVDVKSWERTYGVVFGGGLAPVGVVLVDPGKMLEALPIPVLPGAIIAGTVETENPERLTAAVRFASEDLLFAGRGAESELWMKSKLLEFRAEVQPDGRFILHDLPVDAQVALRILAGETVIHRESDIWLESGRVSRHGLDLASGATLRGVLVDEAGKPVPNYPLGANAGGLLGSILRAGNGLERELVTGQDGRFEFLGLGSGKWQVGPLVGPESEGIAPAVSVLLVGDDLEITIPLYAERFVSGRVQLSTGEPAEITLRGAMADVGWVRTAQTGPDGRFRLGPFPPGAVELRADSAAGSWAYRFQASWGEAQAAAGASDIELRLRAGGGLAGTALDALTLEPVRAFFRLEGAAAEDRRVLGRSTIPKPEFAFWSLVPGEYRLFACTIDGRYAQRAWRVEALDALEGQDLRLKAGGFIEIRNDTSHVLLRVRVRTEDMTLHDVQVPKGQTQRLTVPPGELAVRVASNPRMVTEAPQLERSRTLAVARGATTSWAVGDE